MCSTASDHLLKSDDSWYVKCCPYLVALQASGKTGLFFCSSSSSGCRIEGIQPHAAQLLIRKHAGPAKKSLNHPSACSTSSTAGSSSTAQLQRKRGRRKKSWKGPKSSRAVIVVLMCQGRALL